eukprot:Protomagalhaensia_sp_Gyna_25__2996@NODE_2769_length_897_cov_261_473193_g2311_i0_p1_GENE_NODE_2769_length_897_cov_261_473193_g2311_i0NODE_2769_length_897_cov_261_473193_g2311_i0_p1_ORF_typecomplete_len152_score21_88FAM176/PF14851_6/0_0016NEMP/PF10225_9/0_024RNA_pol_Rpc4/PF05132_14/0_035DUF4834/PF16118_5/0_084CBP_BcsG/PF11658_8/0_21OAD_gamma/PF04277_13/3_6Glycoprotein_G/PF00802_19/3_1e02Glycoprotein_G/PF00802_19/10Stm1_N/PF09598_10/13_NODE_2769_length_897_cov_261_473193_g2311_i0178633
MSGPFIKRVSAEINRLGGTLTAPATRFVRHFIHDPLYKLVYYNESVEKFAAAHPGLFALGIVFSVSLMLVALVHLMHLLILRVWGPSRWHLASEDMKRGRKTQPKKRPSSKESAKESAKTAKTAAKEAAKSAKEAKEAKETRPRRRRKAST